VLESLVYTLYIPINYIFRFTVSKRERISVLLLRHVTFAPGWRHWPWRLHHVYYLWLQSGTRTMCFCILSPTAICLFLVGDPIELISPYTFLFSVRNNLNSKTQALKRGYETNTCGCPRLLSNTLTVQLCYIMQLSMLLRVTKERARGYIKSC